MCIRDGENTVTLCIRLVAYIVTKATRGALPTNWRSNIEIHFFILDLCTYLFSQILRERQKMLSYENVADLPLYCDYMKEVVFNLIR